MECVTEQRGSLETTQTGIPIINYRPPHGAHLCSLWTDPATDRAAASKFLLNIAPDERALCVLETSRESEPRTRSAAADLTAARASVFFTDDVHVAGGVFDPDRMRRFWVDQAHKASESGARHLRAVAEMAWVLRGCPGTDKAPVFESSLNPHLQPLPLSVICQYGSSRFGADVLLAMVLSHPLITIGEMVFFNPFSVGHERFAAHYAALKVDPAAALVPAWAYFLSAQPSLRSMGMFLCNSLPTLITADRFVVVLQGLSSPLQLAVSEDRVVPIDGAGEHGLSAASRGLPLRAEGEWGCVRNGLVDGVAFMTASFADGAGRIVATCDRVYSQQDELRFVTLAWQTAHAVRVPHRACVDVPVSSTAVVAETTHE
jgi:hypothetical protein